MPNRLPTMGYSCQLLEDGEGMQRGFLSKWRVKWERGGAGGDGWVGGQIVRNQRAAWHVRQPKKFTRTT